jgi:hypothetical protein
LVLICREAGVTGNLFASAPLRSMADPRERVLAYIDFRAALIKANRELPDFTCLLGTMVQETFETHPDIREACNQSIFKNGKGATPRHRPRRPTTQPSMACASTKCSAAAGKTDGCGRSRNGPSCQAPRTTPSSATRLSRRSSIRPWPKSAPRERCVRQHTGALL